MFFGHEVKTGQHKAPILTMDKDIKFSQAVLDPASKGNKKDPVVLVADIKGRSFIMAVLDPSQSWQCPLDMMLSAGTDVKFHLRGQGCVHLTGYEFRDDDFEISMSSSDDSEEELEEARKARPAKKIKTKNSPAKTNGLKSNNKPKLGVKGDDNDSDEDDDDVDYNSDDDESLSFGSEEEEDLDTSDDSDAMDHDFKKMNGDASDSYSDSDDDDEGDSTDGKMPDDSDEQLPDSDSD